MAVTTTNIQIEVGRVPMGKGPNWAFLLAHGGAGPQDPSGGMIEQAEKRVATVLNQAGAGIPSDIPSVLKLSWQQATPLERLVMNGTRELEADPLFNAGLGASLQGDGQARLSASFMESQRQKFSAVMNVTNIVHACDLAWALQEQRHCVLDGMGSDDLKRRLGIPATSPVTKDRLAKWISYKRRELAAQADSSGKTGTVGVIGLSGSNHLAASTSTGGVGNEAPGRVGDSPTIAGNYCSKQVAISCTGLGEQIIAFALAPRLALGVESGKTLESVMTKSMELADQRGYSFAAIAIASDPAAGVLEWAAGSVNCRLVWSKIEKCL